MEGRPFGEPGQLIAVTATGGALVGTVAGRYDALNRQKASLLGSLQEATVALSAATTTDEVCEHAVGIATEELGIPAAGVWAVTEGHPLRPIAVAGSVDGGYRPEDDVARTVFESGGTERRNDRSGRRRTDGSVGSEVVTSLDGTGVMCFASPEPGRFDHTDGTAVGLLASATEAAIARADREETLRTQRRLLEQQNERLEEFTSVVSHDLRNPLSVAKGRVDLAREADGGEDLDEAAAALNDMERLHRGPPRARETGTDDRGDGAGFAVRGRRIGLGERRDGRGGTPGRRRRVRRRPRSAQTAVREPVSERRRTRFHEQSAAGR